MNFQDYTIMLANLSVITWDQAAVINAAIDKFDDIRCDQQKDIETEFWEEQ